MATATVEEAPSSVESTLQEKVEDAAYTTRRAIKKARRRAQDAIDAGQDAMYRVRREPFKAVGVAFGAGMLIGAVIGWASTRARTCD